MNRLLSGARARVVFVTLLAAVLGVAGLGAVPPASAAPSGQISGTVTDGTGPIQGIVVELYRFDADGGFWALTGDEDTTKNNGTYSIKKVAPGTYRVGFSSTGQYVDEFYDDHADLEDAADVEVSEGQSITGIDAALAEPGVIRGEVTDEEGNGLAGIEITAYGFNADAEFWEIIGGGSTAADGSYALPFYREGDVRMGFSDAAGGYVSEYYDDKQFVEEADDIPVAFGETLGGIDAVLAVGGHLRGQVTDPQGEGLPGLAVYPSRLVDGEWEFAGSEFGFSTDDDGNYDIGGLPEGTYRLQFEDPEGNYLGEWYDDKTDEDATQIQLAEGATVDLADAVLDPAAHVQGTVTDEEGAPLEFVFVAVWRLADDGHWEIAADSETDADGDYSVDGLPGGTYRVGFQTEGEHVAEYYDDVLTIDAADDVVVDPGATVSDIDAELALAAHITGTVTGPDGLPGDKVGIDAWRWTGTDWEGYEEDFIQQTDVDEPDNGHYDVGGLPPGTYRLEIFAITSGEHEFWDDQPSFELAQDIVVTEAGEMLAGYDVTLEAGQYPFELENLTRPAISGSPVVGQTLTSSTGTWNVKGTTYGYQWFAGGAGVGTNSPTYQPTAADVGKAITVTVFASVAGLGSAAATSAPTAAVTGASTVPQPPPPPPGAKQVANLKLPVIKGTLEVGRRARVTTGLWSPAAVDLTYRWFVGGKRIAKSDTRKLELKEKWVGKRLRVKVIAKAGGYLTTTVLTQRSAKIKS